MATLPSKGPVTLFGAHLAISREPSVMLNYRALSLPQSRAVAKACWGVGVYLSDQRPDHATLSSKVKPHGDPEYNIRKLDGSWLAAIISRSASPLPPPYRAAREQGVEHRGGEGQRKRRFSPNARLSSDQPLGSLLIVSVGAEVRMMYSALRLA